MRKAQKIGMQAKPVNGVVAVAILYISADGMPHVRRMHTNLVLSARFEFLLYKRVLCGPVQNMKVCHGIFAAIIER